MRITPKLLTAASIFLLLMGSNLLADERAPKGKCYLAIGYVNNKAEVKEFILKNKYDPSLYEVFERSDKKLYFTFGKMDKKLFDTVKQRGMLSDKFFCASGKGFNIRYNLDENLELFGGRGSKREAQKRFIDTTFDLENILKKYETISTSPSSTVSNNSIVDNTSSSSLNSEAPKIAQMFGSSENGKIFREQYQEFEDFVRLLDQSFQSSKQSDVGSYFQLADEKNRSFRVSLTWGIYINENFDDFLVDIDGNKFINPKAELRTDLISIGNANDDFPVWNNFRFYLKQFKEQRIFSNALDMMAAELEAKALNYYDSSAMTKGKKTSTRYTKLSDWKFILGSASDKRCKPFIREDFKSSYLIIAPIACVISYEKGDMTQLYWPDVAKLKKIDEVNLLTHLKKGVNERIMAYADLSKSFITDPSNNFTFFSINSGSSKVCSVKFNDGQNSDEIIAHLETKLEDNFKLNTFSSINDLFLEVTQIQEVGCDTLLVNLDEFSKLAKAVNTETYSIMNYSVIDNLFNLNDAQQTYAKVYQGASPAKIANLESITKMDISANNIQYFLELEKQYKLLNLEFNSTNFELVQTISKRIFSNAYISNMLKVTREIQNFRDLGYDLTDPSVFSQVSNIFKNNGIKVSKTQNQLEIYSSLLTAKTPEEINDIFKTLKKVSDLRRETNFDDLYKFYNLQLEVAQSKSLTINAHIDALIIEAEQKRLAAAREREERERQRRLREQEERERFARRYPYTVSVLCDYNGRPFRVGQCLNEGGSIKIDENGSSWEISDIDAFRGVAEKGEFYGSNQWKVNLGSSWYIRAQMGDDGFGTLKIQAKDNRTGKILATRRCSTSYCVVSMRP